ncbi:MAG TPA: sulfite exporter TauE/SafE family protein [Gaiellaceae bacterium]|nr:sulfite exporter TauE/SafE family protein [Gaiellaceae bacterium]
MHFDAETAVLLVLLGIAVGAFGTVVGAGGGFVLTPILLLLYPHTSAETITSISLTAVFFNAASGSTAYLRQRRVDVRSGSLFAAATIPGAVGGALLTGVVSRRLFDVLMGVVLAVLAAWLLSGERMRPQPPKRGIRRRLLRDREGLVYEYDVPIWRGALYSLGVGFVSSFLGIGGGVIHVPLLVRALGFPTHVATATSHYVLAWMAGVGTITHIAAGSFAGGTGVRRALAISAGVVVGAQAGALLSRRIHGKHIEQALALALVALAVRLLVGAA